MFKKKSKIQVFVRHCFYSSASFHKKRYKNFSHEKCFENLLETIDPTKVDLTLILDTHFGMGKTHFIEKETRFPVIKIDAGCEARAFLSLLNIVFERNDSSETLYYFLEDDYLHRKGWADILLEGFSIQQAEYITLFDHRDKYFFDQYQSLQSFLFHTNSCHWRTTPSTTNTYAMRRKTLIKHKDIHQRFSLDRKISADHEKFLALAQEGATLISPIPGWSTHAEPEFASPCHDWAGFFS